MGWIVSIHQAISYHVADTIIKLRRRNCRWYNILYALCTQKIKYESTHISGKGSTADGSCEVYMYNTFTCKENTEVSVRLKLLPETKWFQLATVLK